MEPKQRPRAWAARAFACALTALLSAAHGASAQQGGSDASYTGPAFEGAAVIPDSKEGHVQLNWGAPEVRLELSEDGTLRVRGRLRDMSVVNASLDGQGGVRLTWDGGEADPALEPVRYEVQIATSPDFSDAELLYRGGQRASFMSGLADGTYYFRVRYLAAGYGGETEDEADDRWSEWSPTKRMTVKHHSMQTAWTLFGAGGVMMGLIAAFVVLSTRVESGGQNGGAAGAESGGARD